MSRAPSKHPLEVVMKIIQAGVNHNQHKLAIKRGYEACQKKLEALGQSRNDRYTGCSCCHVRIRKVFTDSGNGVINWMGLDSTLYLGEPCSEARESQSCSDKIRLPLTQVDPGYARLLKKHGQPKDVGWAGRKPKLYGWPKFFGPPSFEIHEYWIDM